MPQFTIKMRVVLETEVAVRSAMDEHDATQQARKMAATLLNMKRNPEIHRVFHFTEFVSRQMTQAEPMEVKKQGGGE